MLVFQNAHPAASVQSLLTTPCVYGEANVGMPFICFHAFYFKFRMHCIDNLRFFHFYLPGIRSMFLVTNAVRFSILSPLFSIVVLVSYLHVISRPVYNLQYFSSKFPDGPSHTAGISLVLLSTFFCVKVIHGSETCVLMRGRRF